MNSPSLFHIAASAFYDALLLLAVFFVATLIFLLIFGSAVVPPKRYFFQAYLFVIAGFYFCWYWIHGGQTLAMQTWKFKVLSRDGSTLTAPVAVCRYLLAAIGMAFFGLGWWWCLIDRERLTLHDRFSGTRLVRVVK